MPKIIQAPDGGPIAFPDDMHDWDIGEAMNRLYPSPGGDAFWQQQRALKADGAPFSAETGRFLSPDEAQAKSRATTVEMNAAARNEDQSGLLQASRTMLRHALFGWGPEATAYPTAAISGEDPRLLADIERKQSDLHYKEHPTWDTLESIGGGTLGLPLMAAGAEALPVIGPGIEATGNALNRIPYLTQGGRQAATEAIAAGRAAPTSLGSGAATAALVGAPIGASEQMANNGASLENAGVGAAAGLVGGAGGNALVRGVGATVGPWATRHAQTLLGEGVPLSPGQVMGGIPQWLESMIGSIPFAGAFTRRAAEVGKEGMNRAVLNRAIQPLEEVLHNANPQAVPRGSLQIGDNIRAGHDAFNHAEDVLQQAYRAVLPHMPLDYHAAVGLPNHPGPLQQAVNGILQAASEHLEPAVYNRLEGIVNRNLFTRLANGIQQNGVVPGNNIQETQSSIRSLVRQFSGDANADNRQMSYYLRNVVNAMDTELERQTRAAGNGQLADALAATNHGYAALTIARNASTRAGQQDGVFTPAALQAAVRNADRSVDHVSMARGTALLQDLSDAAKATIRDFPNSGTPERLAAMRMLEGGSYAGAGASVAGGAASPAIFAPLLIPPALYNPASKALFRAAAGAAPETRNALETYLRSNTPGTLGISANPALGAYMIEHGQNALNGGNR